MQKCGILRSVELTLIMALEVIRNKVALSVTCLNLSPMSLPTRNPSSSDRDLRGQEAVHEQLTTCSMTIIKKMRFNTLDGTSHMIMIFTSIWQNVCASNWAVLVN